MKTYGIRTISFLGLALIAVALFGCRGGDGSGLPDVDLAAPDIAEASPPPPADSPTVGAGLVAPGVGQGGESITLPFSDWDRAVQSVEEPLRFRFTTELEGRLDLVLSAQRPAEVSDLSIQLFREQQSIPPDSETLFLNHCDLRTFVAPGEYTLQVGLSAGAAAPVRLSLHLEHLPACSAVSIPATLELPPAVEGVPYEHDLRLDGVANDRSSFTETGGMLPVGVHLRHHEVVSGTPAPASAGSYALEVLAVVPCAAGSLEVPMTLLLTVEPGATQGDFCAEGPRPDAHVLCLGAGLRLPVGGEATQVVRVIPSPDQEPIAAMQDDLLFDPAHLEIPASEARKATVDCVAPDHAFQASNPRPGVLRFAMISFTGPAVVDTEGNLLEVTVRSIGAPGTYRLAQSRVVLSSSEADAIPVIAPATEITVE